MSNFDTASMKGPSYRGFVISSESTHHGGGKYSHAYRIHYEDRLVHSFGETGDGELSTSARAHLAAERAAKTWLDEHPMRVTYAKKKFTVGAEKNVSSDGTFLSVYDAQRAPVPLGFDEACFSIGRLDFSFRSPHDWEISERDFAE